VSAPGNASAPNPETPASSLPTEAYAPARLRRLTPAELGNAISQLFMGGQALDHRFPDEVAGHRFDNEYDNLGVSVELTSSLQDVAERAAAAFTARLGETWGCSTGVADENCAGQVLDHLGVRVWRRPLTGAERQRLLGLYSLTRAENDFATAMATVIEALIQSPHFLFRFELGLPATQQAPLVALAPYEAAAALSFGLWRSTPDDALLEAAGNGRLSDARGLSEEAGRLLQDPKAQAGVTDFLLQWQDLIRADVMSKSDATFDAALASNMHVEARSFLTRLVWGETPSYAALLTSRETEVDASMARLYGITASGIVTLPVGERSGFLTQAAFLASHTPGAGFNPILPGHFVRTRLLCQELPAPPPGVPDLAANENASTRERYSMHASNSACASCHELMDPIGWGFERYDSLGRYRTTEENGVPLSGGGELKGTDVDGPFVGPSELAQKLVTSVQAQRCFVTQTLRYLLGRDTVAPAFRREIDGNAVEGVMAGGFGATTDIKQMLVALIATEAFRFRDASGLPTTGAQ
jgi:hypothetical protein